MKYILTLILSLFLSFGFASEDSTIVIRDTLSFTNKQLNILNRTESRDTVQAVVAYVSTDELSPSFIFYDDKVRVVFTLEQAQKIKNTFRLYELAKDALEEYGIRENIEIGFVEKLENEILFLGTRIDDLEQQVKEKNQTINGLIEAESKYLEAIEKGEQESELKDDQIKDLKKELKIAKRKLRWVVIGSGIIVTLIVIASL